MKKLMIALIFVGLVVAVVLVTAAPSQAWHRLWHRPYYDPYPYGYGWDYPYGYWPPVIIPQVPQPPVIIQPAPPTTYIEKQPAEQQKPAEQTGQYWYYCREKNAFFSYVEKCPSEWLKVVPPTSPNPPTK